MQIARPPNGFRITEKPLALQTLAAATESTPWLQKAYSNIKERLRMTGHMTGHALGESACRRVFIDVDPTTNAKRFAVSYTVLGDGVTIHKLLVLVN